MTKGLIPSAGPDWQDGLDPTLVLRLTSRAVRPGVIDLSQPGGLIARHRNIAGALPLAERVNRSWFEMTDQNAGSAPIVYVQPKPFLAEIGRPPVATSALQTGPMQAADPKGGSPTTLQSSVPLTASASTAKSHQAPSPSATGPAERERHIASAPRTEVSTPVGADSHTVVVQRKPLGGASPPLMPLAAPASHVDALSGSKQLVGSDLTAAKSGLDARSINRGMLPVVSASTMTRPVDPPSEHGLPLAQVPATRAKRTHDAGTLVVMPVTRLRSSLYIQSSEIPGHPADPARRKDGPVQATSFGGQANDALPRAVPSHPLQPQASATSLPVVRESLIGEIRRAASPLHSALPLAREAPRARQETTEHPPGTRQSRSISARATAMEPGRPRQPVGRELITEKARVAESDRQSAPNIDIEGIVNQVERRFARRLAIETERRGKTRWR